MLTQEFLGYENGDSEMYDRLIKLVRLVERNKIEEREYGAESDATVDAEKDRIISEIWAQVKPAEEPDADSDAAAEVVEVVKTPEEKQADREAKKAAEEALKASVEEAVNGSTILSAFAETDEAKATLVGQLVDRVNVEKIVTAIQKDKRLTMTGLTYFREYVNKSNDLPLEEKTINWQFTQQNEGLSLGGSEIPASIFQSINPIFILIFGLVFTVLWGFMNQMGIEPSTPVKFALGLIQLGLGFACFWYGAVSANGEGMVWVVWLVFGYLFQTTGELCLSPVGLSMVTKLSPTRLVSTVMGTWFLATAFSQFLAAIIAQFTGVSEGGGDSTIPIPLDTVNVYGEVFKLIAISAIISGVICLVLSPILKYWMHEDELGDEELEKKG